jgi:hypothetical protein
MTAREFENHSASIDAPSAAGIAVREHNSAASREAFAQEYVARGGEPWADMLAIQYGAQAAREWY